jgi:hypothetical protein
LLIHPHEEAQIPMQARNRSSTRKVANANAGKAISLPDGGSVRVAGEVVEIRDPEGRLRIRYSGGSAEIVAPAGDLTLAAPEGKVTVRSGRDIELEAPRLRASTTTTEIEAERLEVKADESRMVAGQATLVARRVATTASVLVQNVERFELTATRLVEKTRDAFRDASDLAQTRVGRARTIVKDLYALYSRRTAMASSDDTSIDGSKILLG